jgi:hypothetical protein
VAVDTGVYDVGVDVRYGTRTVACIRRAYVGIDPVYSSRQRLSSSVRRHVGLNIGYLLVSAYLVESSLGVASSVALYGVLVTEEYLGTVALGVRSGHRSGILNPILEHDDVLARDDSLRRALVLTRRGTSLGKREPRARKRHR